MTVLPRAKNLKKIVVALASAIALIAAPTAVATAEPAATDDTVSIDSGSVTWGIKESWRNYLGPDAATLSGGVTRAEDGLYNWPIKSGTYNPETKALHLDLDGKIHYQWYKQGNRYLLDVTFDGLQIDISSTEQVIKGHYTGTSRENPDEIVDHGLQPLAQIDLRSGSFSSEDGKTTWSDLNTSNRGIPLYNTGVLIDPVTITYEGPGGKPKLEEQFGDPGAPRYELGKSYILETEFGKSREFYPSDDGKFIFVIGDIGKPASFNTTAPKGDYKIGVRVLDAATMEKVAQWDQPRPDERPGIKSTFDGKRTLYFTHPGATNKDPITIDKVTFDGTTFAETKAITEVPQVNYITWDKATSKLIVTDVSYEEREFATVYLVDPATNPVTVDKVNVKINLASFDNIDSENQNYYRPTTFSSYHWPVQTAAGLSLFPGGSIYRDKNRKEYPFPAGLTRLDPTLPVVGLVFIKSVLPRSEQFENNHYGYKTLIPTTGDEFFAGGTFNFELGSFFELQGFDAKPLGDPIMDPTMDHEKMDPRYAWDSEHKLVYAYDLKYERLIVFDQQGVKTIMQLPEFHRVRDSDLSEAIRVLPDNNLVLIGEDSDAMERLYRVDLVGFYPEVTAEPQDSRANLGVGETAEVSFHAAPGSDDNAAIKWQIKKPDAALFTDIPGETGQDLNLTVTQEDSGSLYRAIFTNDTGSVATDTAMLDVIYTPRFLQNPTSIEVGTGASPEFSASVEANPVSAMVWQRYDKTSGLWIDIANTDSNFVITNAENHSVIKINSTNADMAGTKLRVKASNDAGTAFSRVAVVGVEQPYEIPADGVDVTGVSFDWAFSGEAQIKSPAGPANYLSAGVSDGTEATYKAVDGDVSIVIVDPANPGEVTAPTFATKGDFIAEGKKQHVRLTGGKGHINADGSGELAYTGAFSLNFYGGLVPFTMSNPKITIDSDGNGVMTADLSGYGSTQENPLEKTPVEPAVNQTILTFSNVQLSPQGQLTVNPNYEGIKVEIPAGDTQQNRDIAGWGSWPQEMVDFQLKTGLKSYWYTTGEADPAVKAPKPFVVDFTKAAIVEDPTTTPKPTELPTTSNPPTSTTSNPSTTPEPTPTPVPLPRSPRGSGSVETIGGGDVFDTLAVVASIVSVTASIMGIWAALANNPHGPLASQVLPLLPGGLKH